MDTQLSRFYLAAHPLYRLMVQFRANGSHQWHPADALRCARVPSPLRGSARLMPAVRRTKKVCAR